MISFVVPAYNEASVIGDSVRSIMVSAKAAGMPFEVIVVDDASTDDTAQIAREAGAEVIHVNCRQISAVRNAGARHARGDALFFVDGDTVLPVETLQAALDALHNGAVGGGSAVVFEGDIPAYARLILPLFIILFRHVRIAAGCFLFCRRDAFERAGGFNEELFAGEEVFMSFALGNLGRFDVVEEPVITSGRKLRQYSAWQLFGTLVRLSLSGTRGVSSRDGLDVWYEGKRESGPSEVDEAPHSVRA